MATLHLVDISGYIIRSFWSLPDLRNPANEPVSAVFGFCKTALAMQRDTLNNGNALVGCVFDGHRKGETHRSALDPNYKANRKPLPDDCRIQFKMVREAVSILGLNPLRAEGFEADDLVASYVEAAVANGIAVTIHSVDKDLMQLVDDERGVALYDPLNAKMIREAEVVAKFGVLPRQLGDVLALIGDVADNIPGVPGVGKTMAPKLINEFGSLERLLDRAHEVPRTATRLALEASADIARKSRELVRLKADVPLPVPVLDLVYNPPLPALVDQFFDRHAFASLRAEVPA